VLSYAWVWSARHHLSSPSQHISNSASGKHLQKNTLFETDRQTVSQTQALT
jgi:hypothetical protein